MHRIRRQRLILLSVMLMACAVAVGLVLFALRQNINLFYTPSQLSELEQLPRHSLRLGGLVMDGSVEHLPDTLSIKFMLTDGQVQYVVVYKGILPNLFREGQGVIVQGQFNQQQLFVAQEVLAKHDENYRPPRLEKKLV